MKKFLVVLGLIFAIFCGFLAYDTYFKEKIPVLTIQKDRIDINKIYIYGTSLNLEGNYSLVNDTDLVLYNGEFISYDINIYDNTFNVSNYINDGIYLDEIPTGEYYMFLREKYIEEEEEKYNYYSLNNTTSYNETVYYTMSNYNKKIVINNVNSQYNTMMMRVTNNKENDIYDVVIDPGHGGMDGGATKYGYKETDFTMDIAMKIKKELKELGLKVKLTYEKDSLSLNEKLPEYGVHGRAVVPREVNAKYTFSIHLNSSYTTSVSGLEVYTAKNINYDFARLLVNNITTNAEITYSNNKINMIENGIYTRNFTDEEIIDSMNDYKKRELLPYDITTNSNYYYIIRETGGIATGAYVDDRNSIILGNPYVTSNIGTETYLLELGYISNKSDLNNIKNNMNLYVTGIVNSIKTLYITEEV